LEAWGSITSNNGRTESSPAFCFKILEWVSLLSDVIFYCTSLTFSYLLQRSQVRISLDKVLLTYSLSISHEVKGWPILASALNLTLPSWNQLTNHIQINTKMSCSHMLVMTSYKSWWPFSPA
jgi:hypothetical protein